MQNWQWLIFWHFFNHRVEIFLKKVKVPFNLWPRFLCPEANVVMISQWNHDNICLWANVVMISLWILPVPCSLVCISDCCVYMALCCCAKKNIYTWYHTENVLYNLNVPLGVIVLRFVFIDSFHPSILLPICLSTHPSIFLY